MDLETLIRDRGLKKIWIAGQIGVRPDYFSHMLRGRMSMPEDKIRLLANVLGSPVGEVRAAIDALRDGAKPPEAA